MHTWNKQTCKVICIRIAACPCWWWLSLTTFLVEDYFLSLHLRTHTDSCNWYFHIFWDFRHLHLYDQFHASHIPSIERSSLLWYSCLHMVIVKIKVVCIQRLVPLQMHQTIIESSVNCLHNYMGLWVSRCTRSNCMYQYNSRKCNYLYVIMTMHELDQCTCYSVKNCFRLGIWRAGDVDGPSTGINGEQQCWFEPSHQISTFRQIIIKKNSSSRLSLSHSNGVYSIISEVDNAILINFPYEHCACCLTKECDKFSGACMDSIGGIKWREQVVHFTRS